MVRKIKPVSRVLKLDTEFSRIKKDASLRSERPLDWSDQWAPHIDLYEKQDEIILEAEVPGVSQIDITLTVHSNRVEIRGMKKENIPAEKIKYLRLEREFGSFRRLVALPSTVAPEKAKAFLENGVLTIRLKKYSPREEKEILVEIRKNED